MIKIKNTPLSNMFHLLKDVKNRGVSACGGAASLLFLVEKAGAKPDELAGALAASKSTVSSIIDSLESAGLASRDRPRGGDARTRTYKPTPAGIRLVRKWIPKA
tara:strand:- start:92 stop:403 length:312 start_codon:yes stop_codon:yes gene_type:complete